MKGYAAVAIVLNGSEVLMIRRAERDDDPWSGDLALPGGRHVDEDRDMLDTAIRELWEEAGVSIERGDVEPITLGVFHPMSYPEYRVYAIAFILGEKPSTRPGEEVTQVFWLDLGNAREDTCLKHVRARGVDLEVPCIKTSYGDVWGLTYRVLKRVARDLL